MTITGFDATITLNDHHVAMAGGRDAEAVAAVRSAIEGMDGAGWISVDKGSWPPHLGEWMVLYPRGRSNRPDTPDWRALHQKVEEIALEALGSVENRLGNRDRP